MTASLYIHIPFCKAKCHYCDFVSFSKCEEEYQIYVEALCLELRQRSESLAGRAIKTIFIGGGTPTVLSPVQLAQIMDTVTSHYNIMRDAEITIESNPGTLTKEIIEYLGKSPINRVSMGLQSTHNPLLKMLGRIHNYETFEKNYRDLRACGMKNINVDLMFGLPGQSLLDFKESLELVTRLEPEHLSCYGLIVEEGTPFYKAFHEDKLDLPDEETEREMYHLCESYLKSKGYVQYEISNYAKSNKVCRHNIVYWRLEDYVGIGVGAHSFFNDKRFENTRSLKDYLSQTGQGKILNENQILVDKKAKMEEFMFLGLRLLSGIKGEEFSKLFGCRIEDVYGAKIDQLSKANLLRRTSGGYTLTKKGLDLSNRVLSDFLLDDGDL